MSWRRSACTNLPLCWNRSSFRARPARRSRRLPSDDRGRVLKRSLLMRENSLRIALFGLAALSAQAVHHDLKATPETVVIGYYGSEAKPVLKIQSGDTVS